MCTLGGERGGQLKRWACIFVFLCHLSLHQAQASKTRNRRLYCTNFFRQYFFLSPACSIAISKCVFLSASYPLKARAILHDCFVHWIMSTLRSKLRVKNLNKRVLVLNFERKLGEPGVTNDTKEPLMAYWIKHLGPNKRLVGLGVRGGGHFGDYRKNEDKRSRILASQQHACSWFMIFRILE